MLVADGHVEYNTSALPEAPPAPPSVAVAAGGAWEMWHEAAGGEDCAHVVDADAPLEQMALADPDDTDYLWLSTNVSWSVLSRQLPPKVEVTGKDGTRVHAFLDGVPAASAVPTAQGAHTLQLLCAAMGVPNGGVGPTTGKGVTAVRVNGVDLMGGTTAGRAPPWSPTPIARPPGEAANEAASEAAPQGERVWRHAWGMVGETRRIYEPASTDRVPWSPVPKASLSRRAGGATLGSHVWLRGYFDRPQPAAGATQTAYALNLTSMLKGVAFVNGFHLGRYWLTPGKCSGSCAPPVKQGRCYMHWKACDEPTQTLYHVPTALLQPTRNLVVLFEEARTSPLPTAGDASTERDDRKPYGVRLVALHAHPERN